MDDASLDEPGIATLSEGQYLFYVDDKIYFIRDLEVGDLTLLVTC